MRRAWTENDITLLTNMVEDKIEKEAIIKDLERDWAIIKVKAKKLGLDMSYMPRGKTGPGKKDIFKNAIPADLRETIRGDSAAISKPIINKDRDSDAPKISNIEIVANWYLAKLGECK